MTSTTSHTDEQQRTPYERERQQETTIHCIDEARHNIQSAIEEARREIPRYSQSVTDFQNEAADATREISENFLNSQKEIVNAIQSAYVPLEKTSIWTRWAIPPWNWMGISPREMADIYARNVSAMTEYMATGARIATNIMFAGLDAMRTTTNYARQNSKEVIRVITNTARPFEQAVKETIQVEGGAEGDGKRDYTISGHRPSTANESNAEPRTTATSTTTYATEGTVNPTGSNATVKTNTFTTEETATAQHGEGKSAKK